MAKFLDDTGLEHLLAKLDDRYATAQQFTQIQQALTQVQTNINNIKSTLENDIDAISPVVYDFADIFGDACWTSATGPFYEELVNVTTAGTKISGIEQIYTEYIAGRTILINGAWTKSNAVPGNFHWTGSGQLTSTGPTSISARVSNVLRYTQSTYRYTAITIDLFVPINTSSFDSRFDATSTNACPSYSGDFTASDHLHGVILGRRYTGIPDAGNDQSKKSRIYYIPPQVPGIN